MKKINWKIILTTCFVCLFPILIGIIFYQQLPEKMAVHFTITNEPDSFASKNFALFGIPILLTLLQLFCCVISDLKGKDQENDKNPRLITIVKWIIPILSIVTSTMMIQISLGNLVDIRKNICLVLGIMFIFMGNYFPKISYEQARGKMYPFPKNENTYRKITMIFGYSFVISGIALLFSILFAPIYSVVILVLMVLISLVELIYCFVKN